MPDFSEETGHLIDPPSLNLSISPYRILYVEDNPQNQKLVEEVFTAQKDIHLKVLATAEDAMAYLGTHATDLILLDINLPGMDGWDMMKAMQADDALKQIPVVALSAQAMKTDIERGEREGFEAYFPKPINIVKLLELIQRVCQKQAGTL